MADVLYEGPVNVNMEGQVAVSGLETYSLMKPRKEQAAHPSTPPPELKSILSSRAARGSHVQAFDVSGQIASINPAALQHIVLNAGDSWSHNEHQRGH